MGLISPTVTHQIVEEPSALVEIWSDQMLIGWLFGQLQVSSWQYSKFLNKYSIVLLCHGGSENDMAYSVVIDESHDIRVLVAPSSLSGTSKGL